MESQQINFTLLNGKEVVFDLKNMSKRTKSISKVKFFDILERLRYVTDMSQEASDMGIDLSVYEAGFYELIDTILSVHYTDPQLDLISFYVSEVQKLPKKFRDSVEVPLTSGPKTFKLRTKEDLWKALNSLSNES